MADSGPLTQPQALALLARTSDPGWLASELSAPDGTAVINARTAVAAATSEALMAQAAACTISDAPGGGPGTCSLVVSRTDTTSSITIPQGYRFLTAEGIDLVLQSPVVIPIGTATATLPLQTLRETELANTYVGAFAALLNPGDALNLSTLGLPAGRSAISPNSDQIFDSPGGNLVLGPGTFPDSHALLYVSSTRIEGASSDWLSVHGDERGVRRKAGETTEEYRARIRMIPDAVSPLAISRAVAAAAANVGLGPVVLVETVNPGCSDAAMAANDLAFQDTVCEGDFFDDALGVDLAAKLPERSLEMVDRRSGRAYFRMDLEGPLKEPDASTMYYDAAFFDDDAFGYPDTDEQRVASAMLAIVDQANAIKAAGVNALPDGRPGTSTDLFIEDRLVIPAIDSLTHATPFGATLLWTLLSDPLATPGSETKGWLLRDALISHTSDAPVEDGQIFHELLFTFSDATQFLTPLYGGTDSEHLTIAKMREMGFFFSKPIVSIAGYMQTAGSLGTVTVTLAGTFWVVEYTLP